MKNDDFFIFFQFAKIAYNLQSYIGFYDRSNQNFGYKKGKPATKKVTSHKKGYMTHIICVNTPPVFC